MKVYQKMKASIVDLSDLLDETVAFRAALAGASTAPGKIQPILAGADEPATIDLPEKDQQRLNNLIAQGEIVGDRFQTIGLS